MIKFHEKCLSVLEELKSKIVALLPAELPTLILSVEEISNSGLCCNLRLSIKTKEEALNWIQKFQEKSLTTYNVDSTFPENTPKVVFKKKYRCHHNTRATYSKSQQPHPKHTDCTAKICITVKQLNMKRSKDEYLKEYPSEVDLRFTHNHPIDSADVLRHRHPTIEVKNIFSEYFANGHSPSSALETYKADLQTKYGEKYYKVTADGATCPTRKWCFDLYYKIFKKQYGKYNKNWCDNLKGVNRQILDLPGPSNAEAIPVIVIDEATSSEDLDIELDNNLKECFTYLENKLITNREVFQAPFRYFVDTLNSIKTESELVSAFHCFGKYNEVGMPFLKKGKNLQGSKTIGVQPTAIAQRKVHIGGGNCQNTGRPAKRSRQEHSYPKRDKENSLELPFIPVKIECIDFE